MGFSSVLEALSADPFQQACQKAFDYKHFKEMDLTKYYYAAKMSDLTIIF